MTKSKKNKSASAPKKSKDVAGRKPSKSAPASGASSTSSSTSGTSSTSASTSSASTSASNSGSKSKSGSGSKSISTSSSTSTDPTSTSTIGASRVKAKPSKPKAKSKASGGSSVEASSVAGRPKLCQKIAKVSAMKGAIKLSSLKTMHAKGFTVKDKHLPGQPYLQQASGPKDKPMVVKLIYLKHCTPRYKITMERYSLKIMRFIGRKNPPVEAFPRIYEIYFTEKCYYIFMGECGSKSLYDLVTDAKHKIGAGHAREYVHQLAGAVAVLQKYGIAHRFIKLKHMMLVDSSGEHLKIVGWSKAVLFYDIAKKKTLYQHKERRARKNNFLPPEAFHRLYDPSKADVWAVGVALVALTTRSYPFHVRAKVKFIKQWREFVKKHEMNPIVRSLANKIFVVDTKKRIHAREMLNHTYFKVDDEKLARKSKRGEPLKREFSLQDEESYDSFENAESLSNDGNKIESIKSLTKSETKSRASRISSSKVGNSQHKSRSRSGSNTAARVHSKSAAKRAKSMTKPKSLVGQKSKNPKSKKPKSKIPKSAKPKSRAKVKPKSVKSLKSKSNSKAKKIKSTVAKKLKSKAVVEAVSKQEVEAEADDVEAEAAQEAEEAGEPEMEEVAKEEAATGEEEAAYDDGGEGVADEAEMAAPEEAAEQANPEEGQPEGDEEQYVDEAAASQVVEAGVGDQDAGEEAEAEAGAEEEAAEEPAKG